MMQKHARISVETPPLIIYEGVMISIMIDYAWIGERCIIGHNIFMASNVITGENVKFRSGCLVIPGLSFRAISS